MVVATGTAHLGVTRWHELPAWSTALSCFKAWLDARGGARNLKEEVIVNHLRAIIERFGESHFTRWYAIAVKTDEQAWATRCSPQRITTC